MAVDGRFGEAEPVGQIPDGEIPDSARGDQLQRRPDDLLLSSCEFHDRMFPMLVIIH